MLFIDVVEYTRLINKFETETILRWRSFVNFIESEILPARCGRIVNSLGDGLLLDFDEVTAGVSAGLAIQASVGRINDGYPPEKHMFLRIGIEVGDVLVDAHDVYGKGAMLGARLMSMASPGECVASRAVFNQLEGDFDVDVKYLGDYYLKHIPEPVSAYRIGPPGPREFANVAEYVGRLVPAIAVIPFQLSYADRSHAMVGEILAEELICGISYSTEIDVISRLSSRVFQTGERRPREIQSQLNVDYLLTGTGRVEGDKVVLDAELVDARSELVVWGQRLTQPIKNILTGGQEFIANITADISRAIVRRELQRTRSHALPTLETYSLLMTGVNLLHSQSQSEFMLAREMLETVASRATRLSLPRAWLAKWHVMRRHQGWSADPDNDSRAAVELCKSALDSDPTSSLALAIDGLVQTHAHKDLDTGFERYSAAVTANPNDSMAWLLKGVLHAFRDEGDIAVRNTQRALSLSPLDPHRYYFESLAATAFLSSRQYELALDYAQRSLRANPAHTSTLRAKVVAEWQMGLERRAQRTAAQLLHLEPEFTVSGWLHGSPSAPYSIGSEWAKVLRRAGIPE